MPGTTVHAYLASSSVTEKKGFITLTTGIKFIKPFFFVTEAPAQLASVFVDVKDFQPSLIFTCKAAPER